MSSSAYSVLVVDDEQSLAKLFKKELSSPGRAIHTAGTGKQARFPHPELLQPLIQAHKGLEVMSVDAACRTYNLLISEGRQVAAALMLS